MFVGEKCIDLPHVLNISLEYQLKLHKMTEP